MVNLGKTVKNLREERNMSRETLAQKLGLSYWAIAKYETGERFPDHETIIKIADFFNVTVDFLLGRPDTNQEPTPAELEKVLRESYIMFDGTPLTVEDKEDVIEFVKVALRAIKKRKNDKE